MSDVSKTVAIIFQGQDQASGVTDKLADNLKTVGDNAGASSGKVGDLAKSAEKLGDTAKPVSILTDAMKALAASLVFKAFVDANVEMEKFERAMTLLKGSSGAAAEEFKYISGVAKTLGLDLFSTADAYVSLTAATKGSALEGAPTREIFEAVSKAMSSLGKSGADAEGALLAISQMVSKGKVSMEELRQQLGERLPGAFQLAAKAMGMTTAEFDAFVSGGNLTAEEFLPKFAAALRNTFGDTTMVESYAAAFARMQTAISEAFIEIGKAGAFDVLTKGIEVATASVVGAVAAFKLIGETVGIVAGAIASGNFRGVGEAIDEAMNRAADSTRSARDAMLGWTKEATPAAAVAQDFADGMTESGQASEKANDAIQKTSAAMKLLGVDSAKVNADFIGAFETIGRSAEATGKDILAAFKGALPKLEEGDFVRALEVLDRALDSGKISYEQYTKAVGDLNSAHVKLNPETKKAAEETKRLADEAKKAEEAAAKLALEYEKLASNERIKAMEFHAEINVAQIEADTKRVQAAFESINSTMDSTADVISTALGMLKDFDSLDWGAIRIIEQQLEQENKMRRENFELQKALTEAQIENLRAQTKQMQHGDALIKIDGAGLQPHLEAFMWEVLKAVQVRVNQQGLGLLLGMP